MGKRMFSMLVALGALSSPLAEAAPPLLRPVSPPVMVRPQFGTLPSASQQPVGSLALRCRGGPVKNIGLQQSPAGYAIFSAHFIRGTKPADQGLEPAQCAWLDRGIAPDEPNVVCQEVNDVILSMAHVATANFDPKNIWLLDFVSSQKNPWIAKLRSPDQYFDFYVKKEGCLRVVQ